MQKMILMMGVMSAGLCFAADFVPAQPVAPQRPVLLAMVAYVAAGNDLGDVAPKKITYAKSKNKIMPKHQKNSHQKFDRKKHRINHPRKDH